METKEINIAEILKDCPRGMKLYSPIYGEVCFDGIEDDSPFLIKATCYLGGMKRTLWFDKYGRVNLYEDNPSKETFLFPSKDQRDWSKFKKPVLPPFEVKRNMNVDYHTFFYDGGTTRVFTDEGTPFDDDMWNFGNYFATNEQAEYAAEKVKELLLSLRKEVEL